jgi:hypothetical protein
LTRPFTRYAREAEAGDILLYQFATASSIAPWLRARSETLVARVQGDRHLRDALSTEAARRISALDLPTAAERAVDLITAPGA